MLWESRFRNTIFHELMQEQRFSKRFQAIVAARKPKLLAVPPISKKLFFSPSADTLSSNFTNELHNYLSKGSVSEYVDPLDWWKLSSSRSVFRQLVHECMSIQATSVLCERLFSVPGDIVSYKRCRLNPNNIQALTCLKSWLKVLPENLDE
ncbi:hypothetical protein P9112_002394 [Eukaryota sp. TZLM1-RC]